MPDSPALSPIELKQELPKYLPALQVSLLEPGPVGVPGLEVWPLVELPAGRKPTRFPTLNPKL